MLEGSAVKGGAGASVVHRTRYTPTAEIVVGCAGRLSVLVPAMVPGRRLHVPMARKTPDRDPTSAGREKTPEHGYEGSSATLSFGTSGTAQ